MRTLLAACLLAIATGAVTPIAATTIANQTFQFTGTCTDCDGTVTATLILDGLYMLGSEFTSSEVVSFTYDGSDLQAPFMFLAGDPELIADGELPAGLPGAADIDISDNGLEFSSSSSDGTWFVNDNTLTPADYGTNGQWASDNGVAAPEPTTIGLAGMALGVGVGAIESFRRRRNLFGYGEHEKDCADNGRE